MRLGIGTKKEGYKCDFPPIKRWLFVPKIMARPKKPKRGTPERLRMDIQEFGKVHDFVAAQIESEGAKRGSKGRAYRAAAKRFGINAKTARLRYNRVHQSNTPGAAIALALSAVGESYKQSGYEEAYELACRVFTAAELRELRLCGMPLISRLAKERLELIELRKQLKGKRK